MFLGSLGTYMSIFWNFLANSQETTYPIETFLTSIFMNTIWHLFAGECHQVVKITVTYSTVIVCRACLHSFFIDRQSTRELRITSIPRDAVI